MKNIFLLIIICSLTLVSCGPITKQEPVKAESSIELSHYPEDFLTMKTINDLENNGNRKPFIYASGENANGKFRIAYYEDYDTFEEMDMNSQWYTTQTVYKSNKYSTSEEISIGSEKTDVMNAYEKYEIEEYHLSQITQMNLDSLDIVLKGINLADTFLYVDNHNVFDEAYTGIDYWGGLGAYIFILDSNDSVVKIVRCNPTSG